MAGPTDVTRTRGFIVDPIYEPVHRLPVAASPRHSFTFTSEQVRTAAALTGLMHAAVAGNDANGTEVQRLRAMEDRVGRELFGVLERYLYLGEGLESIERRMGLPLRSGKALLRVALDLLSAEA